MRRAIGHAIPFVLMAICVVGLFAVNGSWRGLAALAGCLVASAVAAGALRLMKWLIGDDEVRRG